MSQWTLLYIDPGSGSYLIQVIVAAVLGFLFYFRNAWYKIKSFFMKKPKAKEEEKTDEA